MTIKELRAESGLTQQALADLTHIPKRTIEDWEGGRRTPPDYLIELIAFFLHHRSE
jgi:putative transcriptional regulator